MHGCPSVPPSLLANALLLQTHDRVSDEKAKAPTLSGEAIDVEDVIKVLRIIEAACESSASGKTVTL